MQSPSNDQQSSCGLEKAFRNGFEESRAIQCERPSVASCLSSSAALLFPTMRGTRDVDRVMNTKNKSRISIDDAVHYDMHGVCRSIHTAWR